MTLKDQLQDWVDIDTAQHLMAVDFGLVEPSGEAYHKYKWVYWSENPIGKKLYDILMSLVEMGCLFYDDEEQKVKWNNDYSIDSL
jgi:hypothetical protein